MRSKLSGEAAYYFVQLVRDTGCNSVSPPAMAVVAGWLRSVTLKPTVHNHFGFDSNCAASLMYFERT